MSKVRLGNYDMRRVQAVLNVPLADTFKVRLGVDRQQRDGYLKNRIGHRAERTSTTSTTSPPALSIVADLTPDLENYTIASYSNSDTNGTSFRRSSVCNARSSRHTSPAGHC